VEVEHVTELLVSGRAIGYLDMSRVIDVADFVDALERIAKGASVVDPHSFRRWSRLVGATTLWRCFAREQEVVMLMAEGPVERPKPVTTTGSGPSSPTLRSGDVEQIANRVGREGGLWQEAHSWA
jgi:hypothetical protein